MNISRSNSSKLPSNSSTRSLPSSDSGSETHEQKLRSSIQKCLSRMPEENDKRDIASALSNINKLSGIVASNHQVDGQKSLFNRR